MTKQMTTSDRARAAWQRKQWSSTEVPATGSALEPEKVCQESIDETGGDTCTTPDDPSKPTLPADAAA